MRFGKYAAVIVVLALAATAVAAVTFVNPPPFQLQRHILFDGAGFTYSGPDDPFLWESDWLQMSTSVRYYTQVSGLDSRWALLGIDNYFGVEPISGWIRLHIDNWDDPRLEKLIWGEIEWMTYGEVDFQIQGPPGYQAELNPVSSQPLPDGFYLDNAFMTVKPNPPWEEFYWTFTVPAGGMFLIDRIEIATACVPEPSSLLALAYGLSSAGLLSIRRKRR